jgi:hypothetical protein
VLVCCTDFIVSSKIPDPTARRILAVLTKSNILKKIEKGKGRTPGKFVFAHLLNIAEGKEIF